MARVLIIDDDTQVRELVRQMLEADGHEVAQAADGVQGIEAFAEHPADLVFVDLFMPGRDGWATIRALQDKAPGVPFVIITGGGALEGLGRGSSGTLDSLRGLAEFRVLRKPFAWAALSAAVNELLSRATAPRGAS